MIVGDLFTISTQTALTPGIVQALDFLSSAQLPELPDGRIEIAGSQVFVILSTYETRPVSKIIEVEGHRRYLDLQYLAEGEEMIGWAPEPVVPKASGYDFDRDAWTGPLPADRLSWIRIWRGMGMLLYPSDGHAPQFATGEPSPVRKVVVKIAV